MSDRVNLCERCHTPQKNSRLGAGVLQFGRALVRRITNGEIIPWRMRHRGGVWNTMVGVHFRRIWLRRELHLATRHLPNDVTVVIPVRNRVDYRICNSLRSLRGQKYSHGEVMITIVDYGSEPRAASQLRSLSEEFGAEYVRTEANGPWSRAHSSNIGIKRAKTKFVLSTDVDVVFAENYLSVAIQALCESPLRVVYSQCLDLPESCERELKMSASGDATLDLERLRAMGRSCRRDGMDSLGINVSYTFFYRFVRGYDEYYRYYGVEDDDLARRFSYLGLRPLSVSGSTYYLHQWHPQGFRKPNETYVVEALRNVSYGMSRHSILRNREGWGDV